MFPPEWDSIQIDWVLLLSSLMLSFSSRFQSSSRISATDLQLQPPCTPLTWALLNSEADRRAWTCRRGLTLPSPLFFRMSAPDVLPAALARRQRWYVGGAKAGFSPSVICGLPPVCTPTRYSVTFADACTQADFLYMLTKPALRAYKCFWMFISRFDVSV